MGAIEELESFGNRKGRVLVVFGTRPEAIKLAPVVHELRTNTEQVETVVCATGQHRSMVDQVGAALGMMPDIDLRLMRRDQGLAALTARANLAIDEVLEEVRPDIVLVQGDTTTAMVAALASYYRQVRVGHVEAGLRTGDLFSPFPEEANRRIISTLAFWHFAPTERSVRALRDEGVPEGSIHLTGNTVIDALLSVAELESSGPDSVLRVLPHERLVLVTAHRREAFGEPLALLCSALRQLVLEVGDIHVVYPVHLNPNVQGPVRRLLSGVERISLIEPLDYIAFAQLMGRATLILTDSGGIQEEAPALGVPVLVLRDKTERPEAIDAGVARLVGTDPNRIISEAKRLLTDESARRAMITGRSPYGDGHAAERIVSVLLGRGMQPPWDHAPA